MKRAAARAALAQLYDQLPALECKGLCQESCGPILASTVELETVAERGMDLTAPGHGLTCPALVATFGAGTCSVYDARPMICRLWGAVEGMACPHGCRPEGGHLSDEQGHALLGQSLAIGGRPSATAEATVMARAGLSRRSR